MATWFAEHPAAGLRAYGNYRGDITDVEFLSRYPHLRSFAIDSMRSGTPPDLTGLRHLPDVLLRLHLGVPSGTAGEELLGRCATLTDLTIAEHPQLPENLSALTTLRRLSLGGPFRGIERTRSLKGVEELALARQTLSDLTPLTGMARLRSLSLLLGGTKDVSALVRFRRLQHLRLSRIRGLADVSVLPRLTAVEVLVLEELPRITVLPDLSTLTRLRRVELHTMKGLTDLAPLAAAPALEELWISNAGHLQPDAIAPFVGHPTLQHARLGFGSTRKNERARELLGLPDL